MIIIDSVRQPKPHTTAQALAKILRSAPPKEIDIAAAYITASGLKVLLQVFKENLDEKGHKAKIRWLTSFDYCRTEPIALEKIMSLAGSSVRIHDSKFCLSRSCTPRIPFHPKTFFLRNAQYDYMLAGSGNISRSGLSSGYEAGLSLGIDRQATNLELSAAQAIKQSRRWFSSAWKNADTLTPMMLTDYSFFFESVEKLKNPSPTEDDIASDHTDTGALSTDDLQRLRVCRNFWIEAGNITKNRGPNLPGNQLMMKRLSRVFFGFSPNSVPENSSIGSINLSFGHSPFELYSITYSDNKMDKLVLPIPGQDGPIEYDNKYLLFTKTSLGNFTLTLGSDIDRNNWIRSSKKIEGAYAMKSGRQWGVF